MRNDGFTWARAHFVLKIELLRWPEHHFVGAEGGEVPRRGVTLVRMFFCFSHMFEKKRVRASAGAHFSKVGRETLG